MITLYCTDNNDYDDNDYDDDNYHNDENDDA